MPMNGTASRTNSNTWSANPVFMNPIADASTALPYGSDLLVVAADRLLDRFAAQLPDLSQALVLVPDEESARRMRRELLARAEKQGCSALLGPPVHALRNWIGRRPLPGLSVISDHRRELLLVDALRDHPQLYGEGNVWALADSLLELFDELTLNRTGLPKDLESFRRRVAEGYGLSSDGLAALGVETRIVHTLWHAWHDQMEAQGVVDRNTAYLLQLNAAAEQLAAERPEVYLIMGGQPSRAELQWLQQLLKAGRAHLFLHGGPDSPAAQSDYLRDGVAGPLRRGLKLAAPPEESEPRGRFLNAAFGSGALAERAQRFAAQNDPDEGLALFAAGDSEEEALVVDLQVRLWLRAGKRDIAIVTENRRLARRVRALLERAGIQLQDRAGWALSTTSAAAVIERWLECVEEDFPYHPMLDLLKSPFAFGGEDREAHLAAVYRLEQDIVRHENIARGLQRYRTHVRYRCRRLPGDVATQLFDTVEPILDRLEKASASLGPMLHGGRHPPGSYLTGLLESLEVLGARQALEADAAGIRLIEEIEAMRAAETRDMQPIDWLEFRTWLGRALERVNFRPPDSGSRVRLLNLAQARSGRFEALVLAGAEREHLPGSGSTSPFFNDAVRRELGLPDQRERLAEHFHGFRAMLQAAPEVLITLRREQDGEDIIPSPWVELLRTFHQLACDHPIESSQLEALLSRPEARVSAPEAAPRPGPVGPCRVRAVPGLLPGTVSASSYQQLMDCPYQFYAARMLSLAPPEEIREALAKSDYGERVHRCLEAFHCDVEGLPGPFAVPVTESNRHDAVTLLESISEAVFARDLEDNFLHRGWLRRWRDFIPGYIEWQLRRDAEQWRVARVEAKVDREDAVAGAKLRGRIDRMDCSEEGLGVIDYKTGGIPDGEAVVRGESVQLPFYALLAEGGPVRRVEYLHFERGRVSSRHAMEYGELEHLASGIGGRLERLMADLNAGAELPSWGDESTCGYCRFGGLCRRDQWVS